MGLMFYEKYLSIDSRKRANLAVTNLVGPMGRVARILLPLPVGSTMFIDAPIQRSQV